jgi:outer membrane murein-binding lipoprotein Lpp
MKFMTVAVLAALLVAGCVSPYGQVVSEQPVRLSSRQVSEVQSAVTYTLKDPTSAMYRNIKGVKKTTDKGISFTQVCGEVNGKNAFGGYVGFTQFHGEYGPDGKFVLRNLDGYNNSMSQWVCAS